MSSKAEDVNRKGLDGGTPLEKAPDPALGDGVIAKERYTDAAFMQAEWDNIWTQVWLVGCLERDLDEPGAYCATEIGPESVLLVRQDDGWHLQGTEEQYVYQVLKLKSSP